MRADLVNTFAFLKLAINENKELKLQLLGAGVIVRSLNLKLDDQPHTGAMNYGTLPISKRIPAASIVQMERTSVLFLLK